MQEHGTGIEVEKKVGVLLVPLKPFERQYFSLAVLQIWG